MGYASDLTDEQWAVVEPVLTSASKRGPRHSGLRTVVDGLLYIAHTGCQWRYLPGEYGPWTRLWSQFRRWTRNRTWERLLAALHAAVRRSVGRKTDTPTMVVIDPSLARGASQGGPTFHDKGGPYGATKGAKKVIAVDTTGLPVAARVVPASVSDGRCVEALLADMMEAGTGGLLECVKTDLGVQVGTERRMAAAYGLRVERLGRRGAKRGEFVPIPQAWKVEVAHGRLGRSRRLSKSFEKTSTSGTGWLQVACVALVLNRFHK